MIHPFSHFQFRLIYGDQLPTYTTCKKNAGLKHLFRLPSKWGNGMAKSSCSNWITIRFQPMNIDNILFSWTIVKIVFKTYTFLVYHQLARLPYLLFFQEGGRVSEIFELTYFMPFCDSDQLGAAVFFWTFNIPALLSFCEKNWLWRE